MILIEIDPVPGFDGIYPGMKFKFNFLNKSVLTIGQKQVEQFHFDISEMKTSASDRYDLKLKFEQIK